MRNAHPPLRFVIGDESAGAELWRHNQTVSQPQTVHYDIGCNFSQHLQNHVSHD